MVTRPRMKASQYRILLASWLLLVILQMLPAVATASNSAILEMPSGAELEIARFGNHKQNIVVWLPSERGIQPSMHTHAGKLARLGLETWLIDLHQSYFLTPGNHSLSNVPLIDMVFLFEYLTETLKRDIVILSGQRGAQLSLIAARQWQIRNTGSNRIKGLVLMHPNLYRKTPEMGSQADYLPITELINLPIYLINAEYSTKSLRRKELVAMLQAGGSQVYEHWLEGVQGGFHVKQESELQNSDREARQNFPKLLMSSVSLLHKSQVPTRAVDSPLDFIEFSNATSMQQTLSNLSSSQSAPGLSLTSLSGDRFTLRDYRGRVVLINFWASWCTPCVREMPSLEQLRARLPAERFELISVNIGEDPQRIKRFMSTYNIDVPVLLDETGASAIDWKVYVYPSSFVIDGNGKIRYSYAGGLEWDSQEMVDQLTQLIAEK